MKKILITGDCLIPSGAGDGAMRTAYTGSVLELEDAVAVAVMVAQRGELAGDDAKLVDTTSKRERAADKAATAQVPAAPAA